MTEQYQLMPTLAPDEYAALKADIEHRGVQVPVEYDENENILDGHHRVMACRELGISDWPRVVRIGMTEEQKIEHVLALNLDRRHLSREQRAELVASLRGQGWSTRRIADRLNVSQPTVLRDLATDTNVSVETVTGKDGKTRSAKKPKLQPKPTSLFNPSERDIEKAQEVVEAAEAEPETFSDLAEKMNETGNVDGAYKEMQRRLREEARREMAQTAAALPESERYTIECADVRTYTASQCFDFIITDPPYPREYLDLYGVLATRACEWLKPGGLLLTMCGQSYLDQIMAMMDQHLTYYWTGCYYTPGQPTPLRTRQVNTSWKPILIYGRQGDDYKGKIFGDVWISDRNEKDLHKWGQSESGMYAIISQVCLPGQSIFDPFCGAGTTGAAALKHGCTFAGIDCDAQNVGITRARLAGGAE